MAVLRGETLYSYRIRGFITLAGTPLPCEIRKKLSTFTLQVSLPNNYLSTFKNKD